MTFVIRNNDNDKILSFLIVMLFQRIKKNLRALWAAFPKLLVPVSSPKSTCLTTSYCVHFALFSSLVVKEQIRDKKWRLSNLIRTGDGWNPPPLRLIGLKKYSDDQSLKLLYFSASFSSLVIKEQIRDKKWRLSNLNVGRILTVFLPLLKKILRRPE